MAKKYCDPVRQIQEAEFQKNKTQLKGKKDRRHVTARGSYLDLVAKQHPKKHPGPQHPDFYQKKLEKKRQLTNKEKMGFKKMTFIDDIYKANKKNPKPGPGKYNIIKTDKQIKQELKELQQKKAHNPERTNFLSEIQYIGLNSPGAGNYNPVVPIIL